MAFVPPLVGRDIGGYHRDLVRFDGPRNADTAPTRRVLSKQEIATLLASQAKTASTSHAVCTIPGAAHGQEGPALRKGLRPKLRRHGKHAS